MRSNLVDTFSIQNRRWNWIWTRLGWLGNSWSTDIQLHGQVMAKQNAAAVAVTFRKI